VQTTSNTRGSLHVRSIYEFQLIHYPHDLIKGDVNAIDLIQSPPASKSNNLFSDPSLSGPYRPYYNTASSQVSRCRSKAWEQLARSTTTMNRLQRELHSTRHLFNKHYPLRELLKDGNHRRVLLIQYIGFDYDDWGGWRWYLLGSAVEKSLLRSSENF